MSVHIHINEDEVSDKPQTATEAKGNKQLKKFKITAVIPAVQYGNLQPEYEVEAESFEAAEKIAMPYIEGLWARYCQKGSELKKKNSGKFVKVVSELTGATVFYNATDHVYVNKDGEKFLSGSVFAHKFTPEFKKEMVLQAMQKKYDIPAEDISDMWKMKADVSNGLGTAIHAALEMYGRYSDIGEKTGAKKKVNSALHNHPLIENIVTEFYKGREKEKALYEPFVVDDERLLCGQIDRFLIVDEKKKICRIQDFKTNVDILEVNQYEKTLLAPFTEMENNKLNCYKLQLSFYGNIVEKYGWKVQGLDIFHHNGIKWETHSSKILDLSEVL